MFKVVESRATPPDTVTREVRLADEAVVVVLVDAEENDASLIWSPGEAHSPGDVVPDWIRSFPTTYASAKIDCQAVDTEGDVARREFVVGTVSASILSHLRSVNPSLPEHFLLSAGDCALEIRMDGDRIERCAIHLRTVEPALVAQFVTAYLATRIPIVPKLAQMQMGQLIHDGLVAPLPFLDTTRRDATWAVGNA